ncbi:DUF1016 N-terminal domain-containing protein [Occultella aeris]|uniref:DUF1016 N-terminal domain-containing protein n=1 Tax=Occultella aeris TaxID=2761496 RepID=UPI003B42F3EB
MADARWRAQRVVNTELVGTYWRSGRTILDRLGTEACGTSVINRLSEDLQVAFPGSRGFSHRNLRYMRTSAQAWSDEVWQQPAAKLSLGPHHGAVGQTRDRVRARLVRASSGRVRLVPQRIAEPDHEQPARLRRRRPLELCRSPASCRLRTRPATHPRSLRAGIPRPHRPCGRTRETAETVSSGRVVADEEPVPPQRDRGTRVWRPGMQ